MNTALALEAIPRRMAEMGHADRYTTETRTLLVEAGKTLHIDAWNSWCWFPSDTTGKGIPLTVESNFGLLDLAVGTHREQQHEHTGRIAVRNPTTGPLYTTFITATPKTER